MTRRVTGVACRMKSSLSGDETVRQRIREIVGIKGWIAAVGLQAVVLQAVLLSATTITTASQISAAEYTGDRVARLIKERLASEGLDGEPRLDADRTFPACLAALQIDPMFGGWNTVTVRCDDEPGWQFAIRTKLSSRPAPVPIRDFRPGTTADTNRIERAILSSLRSPRAADEIDVVALSRSVSRNDMIGANDLVMVAVSERNALGAFFDPADVIGRRVKIGVGADQPLMAHHLHPDYLVEEGDEVLITGSAGGISVDMIGYALDNGQIGEWIGVENASSGKTVRGKVTGEKKVRVIAKK